MKWNAFRILLPVLCLFGTWFLTSSWLDREVRNWFERDLQTRAQILGRALEPRIKRLREGSDPALGEETLESLAEDEKILAVGLCDRTILTWRTSFFPKSVTCTLPTGYSERKIVAGKTLYLTNVSLEGSVELLFIHDLSFALNRTESARRYTSGLLTFIALLTVISAYLARREGSKSATRHLTEAIRERGHIEPSKLSSDYTPALRELRQLVSEVDHEKRLQGEAKIVWTADTLKQILVRKFSEEQILTVANRQPYTHIRNGSSIEVQLPASGLVSALEPVMRACSGIWIAHGNGSADRETVDAHDRVWVPPQEHSYQIRRIWLTEEEERGYYYGFSNEGLWPLCHIAHTRPKFRRVDWEMYQAVNEKFADAIVEEADREDPIVLVQDYHFALLPALIRKRLPDATIITFWHIPWPNPESFGICPWAREIVAGLLGSTVMGFHTKHHTNNFLDTVDRLLECRIDRELHGIVFQGKFTEVRHYPISIEYPPKWLDLSVSSEQCKAKICKEHNLPLETQTILGVERLDYTKGILERLLAYERFLQLHPSAVGTTCLLQVASPSRSQIPAYHFFASEVASVVDRINGSFTSRIPPIIFLERHHSPKEVFEYYRACDVCVVTSLHDGMNLVAKEFVSAREDELGCLILSEFTGASRELSEALIVNPYDIDQCAEAMHRALTMSPKEQRHRMVSMRQHVKEHNVYQWAGQMLLDASYLRERSRLASVLQSALDQA